MQKGFLGEVSVSAEDLELINKYSRKTLTAEDVYVFSVVLCDNDVDRDFEQFTPETLKAFETMFVGKTGIMDHSMRSDNQIARTYHCEVQQTGELNSIGEPYHRLTAKAYMPRTSKTQELIERLEAGILKEVSVGCSVAREICSICGADRRREHCGHKKGEYYSDGIKNIQCHARLEEPSDAYEWSFVAVPAQRRAGVIKSYRDNKEGMENLTAKEIIKGFGENEVTLSAAEVKTIKQEFEALEATATGYLEELRAKALSGCAKLLPQLNGEVLDAILEGMSPSQLKAFGEALMKSSPLPPQLIGKSTSEETENHEFVI